MADFHIADTILEQLADLAGPVWHRFISVTKIIKMEKGIKFLYQARSKVGNGCMIELNEGTDTYEMTFYTARGAQYKVHHHQGDIYCDQLVEIFEAQTGLFLHF